MKLNAAVMFGGESVEHEISILSAMQVMQALDKERYEVFPIYIAKDHTMYQDVSLWELDTYRDLDSLMKNMRKVNLIREGNHVVIEPLKHSLFTKKQVIDIVLPVIHGTNGEDGTIQGYLEMLKVPYCGCRVLGAAIGQDKVIMKEILDYHHIPTCPWFYATMYDDLKEIMDKGEELGYPLIVKPANLGSSVGIGIAENEKEFQSCLEEGFQYDRKVLVEKVVVKLREINASVMGNARTSEVSQLEEVLKSDEILSYQDKYQGNDKTKGMVSASRILPAALSEAKQKEIEEMAKRTFHELNAQGICRIDFLMDDESGMVYVNEINTIPGSLAFYLWKGKGYDFTTLMDQWIALAIEEEKHKDQQITAYDTNILANASLSGSKGTK